MIKCELFNDHFQNFKNKNIPKAQLLLTDIPYNLANWAFASNPAWYVDGDNSKGESNLANSSFFDTDKNFNIAEFFHFANKLLKPEPKESGTAPAMIIFCAFQQMHDIAEYGKKYGFNKSYPMFFIKNFSAQVLKANMKIVGATEYAMVLYRDKLPKFRNGGNMVFNWQSWVKDGKNYPKLHPTQKPIAVLKKIIQVFTDMGDTVIDPCAGSGSTLRAAYELGRNSYGFEIKKDFFQDAKEKMLSLNTFQLQLGDENYYSEEKLLRQKYEQKKLI